jgi:hypothetical protein
MQGQLSNVPWDDFAKHWKKHRSFWMEVGQKTWEIPFESWYLAETDQTCVQPSPEGMQVIVGSFGFVLGLFWLCIRSLLTRPACNPPPRVCRYA